MLRSPDSNGCTALHSAAIGDAVGAIDTLIEAGANINVQGGKYDDARSTPLHMASKKGSPEAALSLVKHGADVHRFNREHDSALRLAARDDHIAIGKTLLAAGARVNFRQAYWESALDSACWGGHVDIVTTLIQHGAIVDAADSRGCTALFKIGQENSVAVIDKLVAAGASVNGMVDHYGRTPLHPAFMDECPAEAIVSMLRHEARVNVKDNDGKTPLHAACVEGCSEGIRALVQHGEDINAITAEGRTPLSLAADNNWDDATKFLLDAGADVNAPARITDESQALSLAASGECVDATKVLIQHGADVNARDTNGYSALHHAALGNQVGAIDALMSAGAIIDAQENCMSTPLAIAFRSAFRRGKKKDNRGSEEFASMIALLKHGADPNIRNIEKGCPDTLLHYCIAHRCPIPVFGELLAAGPNLEARDGKGCTPLHAAGNNLDLLQALLGGGRIWKRKILRVGPRYTRPQTAETCSLSMLSSVPGPPQM